MWINVLICDYCLEEIPSREPAYKTNTAMDVTVACESCYVDGVDY